MALTQAEATGGMAQGGAQKTFPCSSCGAKLTFSIGQQSLACEHCGHTQALQFAEGAKVEERDLESALDAQIERRATQGQFAGSHEVKCTGCGATVVFEETLTSSQCAYCGAPIQRANAHEAQRRLPVDGLCTFQVERPQAQGALKEWVKGRWFAPSDWKQRGVDGKLDGVYMPYFTFDAMTFTRYRGERGDAYYVTVGEGKNERKERRVRWSAAFGSFQRFFDDICVPALKSLPEALLRGLEPWPLQKMIPFTDQALSGKLAHTYELELKQCFGVAKARIDAELKDEVHHRIGGDEQRIHELQTQLSALTYKHVLLPVWILAYRYGDKSFRVVVNAMNGKVEGERPWSAVKIALAAVAAAILAFVVYKLAQ